MQQYYYVVNLCDKFYIFKSLHWSLVIMDGKKWIQVYVQINARLILEAFLLYVGE